MLFRACLRPMQLRFWTWSLPPDNDPYSHLKIHLLQMYALLAYLRYEAITSLPFSGDMLPAAQMSKMLSLLPFGHEACFFLHGVFL